MSKYSAVQTLVKSKLMKLPHKEFYDLALKFMLQKTISPEYLFFPFQPGLVDEIRKGELLEIRGRYRRSTFDVTKWEIKKEARKKCWIDHIGTIRKEILIAVIAIVLVDTIAGFHDEYSYLAVVKLFEKFLSELNGIKI